MYVTELTLNQDNLFAMRDVADRYETHRSVKRLTEGMERRVLWRLDMQREWRLTVQCERPLEPRYVSKAMPGYADQVRSAEVATNFDPGDLLLFQLEANPTVKCAKKRRALKSMAELQEWLQRKFDDAGCELLDFAILKQQALRLYRQKRPDEQENDDENGCKYAMFNSVRFMGSTKVVDLKALKDTLEAGIGSAKGYGFGLLSLRPIPYRDIAGVKVSKSVC